MLIGFLPAIMGVGSLLSGLGGLFAGRGQERRAIGFEEELLRRGRGAGRRAERFFANIDPTTFGLSIMDPTEAVRGASALSGRALSGFLETARPEFERGLREQIAGVVGGLGRRGGLVDRTVGEATQDLTRAAAAFTAQQVPSILGFARGQQELGFERGRLTNLLARQDENLLLEALTGLRDASQARANAARRGYFGLAGLLGQAASMFGGAGGGGGS